LSFVKKDNGRTNEGEEAGQSLRCSAMIAGYAPGISETEPLPGKSLPEE